jgi:hypothetical protein
MEKTLNNSDVPGTRKNVPDVKVVGNVDMFQLPIVSLKDSQE